MNKGIIRFIAPLLFVVTGIMALAQESDYWEAASWFAFAAAVLIFSMKPANGSVNKSWQTVALGFMALGILLLILRLTGVLPEPIRPLP